MNYKKVTLQVEKELPVIPGALDVSEQTPGMYIAYGSFVPNATGKGRHRGAEQVVAYIRENKNGKYLVIAEQETLDKLGAHSGAVESDKVLMNYICGGVDIGSIVGRPKPVEVEVELIA